MVQHNKQLGHRLLITPVPTVDENMPGYIIRLTEANRYESPLWILRYVLITKSHYMPDSMLSENIDFDRMSDLTGAPVGALRSLTYQETDPGIQDRYFGRHRIARYFIKGAHPKVCPECLREKGYLSRFWDLNIYTVCLHHGVKLVDHCPSCKKQFSWYRNEVCKCRCGLDMRTIQSPSTWDEGRDISKHIYDLTMQKTSDYVFSHLSMGDFMQVLVFLAGQHANITDTSGKHLAGKNNREIHEHLKPAWHTLTHWPEAFFELLATKKTASRQKKYHLKTGLSKDFGSLYEQWRKSFDAPQFSFLANAFEHYLSQHWDGGYITSKCHFFRDRLVEDTKFISLGQAVDILGMRKTRIDRLIRQGYLSATTTEMGRNTLYRIERASAESLQNRLAQSSTLNDAAARLCINRHAAGRLVQRGLLAALIGKNQEVNENEWSIEHSAIERLLERVRKSMVPSAGGRALSLIDAVRKLSILKYDITAFLEQVLAGKISPCAEVPGKGLPGFLFSETALASYISSELENQKGSHMNLQDVAQYLHIKQDALLCWLKKGFFANTSVGDFRTWRIPVESVHAFKKKYVLLAHIARSERTSPRKLLERLQNLGVFPVTGPMVDGGRQYLYKVSQISTLSIDCSNYWPKG